MKKPLFALLAAALFAALPASANVVTTLHETMASGAHFDGTLTFADNYGNLLDVDGTLSGGGYGNVHFGWTWQAFESGLPNDFDGNGATWEDWLMDGDVGGQYTYYIGLSWAPNQASFTPLLSPQVDIYYASVNSQDAVVSATVGDLPEPASVTLLGLGMLGLLLQRRRKA